MVGARQPTLALRNAPVSDVGEELRTPPCIFPIVRMPVAHRTRLQRPRRVVLERRRPDRRARSRNAHLVMGHREPRTGRVPA